MPCHHSLDEYSHAYIKGGAQLTEAKSVLFPTTLGRTARLSDRPMRQADAYRMIVGVRLRQVSSPELGTIRSVLQVSRNIYAMAESLSWHSKWQLMKVPG
jgi:hypothetical protein